MKIFHYSGKPPAEGQFYKATNHGRPCTQIHFHGIGFTIDQSVPLSETLKRVLEASAARNLQDGNPPHKLHPAYVSLADPALFRNPEPGQLMIGYPGMSVVELATIRPNAPPGKRP